MDRQGHAPNVGMSLAGLGGTPQVAFSILVLGCSPKVRFIVARSKVRLPQHEWTLLTCCAPKEGGLLKLSAENCVKITRVRVRMA
jgi:hypothetical protein